MAGRDDAATNRLRAAAVLSPLAGVAGWLLSSNPLVGAGLSVVAIVLCLLVPMGRKD